MLAIPVATRGANEMHLILIFSDDGMERLKAADPAQIEVSRLGEPWCHRKVVGVTLAYESVENLAKVMRWLDAGDYQSAFKFITRGFTFRPEKGDDDFPYLNLGGPKQ